MNQPAARRTLTFVAVGLVVVTAAIIGVVAHRSASSSTLSVTGIVSGVLGGTRIAEDGVVTADDGVLPGGVTVFDDEYAGVARLDPGLLGALRRAATDAARDGVQIFVNSGWRSRDYQNQLLREAVAKYGSESEAARWVATADTSPHVSGEAVDVGETDASAWLSRRGAGYGLCRIYRNEPWHFELRTEAVEQRCPPLYTDPTHDPRMQP